MLSWSARAKIQSQVGGSQLSNGANRALWAQGYEWYAEVGLYRAGARWYSPALGHWLSPDPLGQAGGLNLYAYCANDPVNGTDPSGLAVNDGAGAHTNLPLDMAWRMSQTGSIGDDYSSNGLYAVARVPQFGASSNSNLAISGTLNSNALTIDYVKYSGDWSKEDAENFKKGLDQQWQDPDKRAEWEKRFSSPDEYAISPDHSVLAFNGGAINFNMKYYQELNWFQHFVNWALGNIVSAEAEGGNQDKMLGKKAADKAARDLGYEGAEDAKSQNGAEPTSRFDLYRGKDGQIIIKRKGGSGPGEPLQPLN